MQYAPNVSIRCPMSEPAQQDPPVLYLDYDGVTHPDRAFVDRHGRIYLRGDGTLFQWANILEGALATSPEVQIVLSTSWVRVRSYSYAKKRLPESLRQRVVGATWHSEFQRDADLRAWWDQASRWETIRADLDRRRPTSWMAIDDDVEAWPSAFDAHLVATHGDDGLSSAWAQRRLRSVLKDLNTGRLAHRPAPIAGPAGGVLWTVPRPASRRHAPGR
jgi:hypothetical protein